MPETIIQGSACKGEACPDSINDYISEFDNTQIEELTIETSETSIGRDTLSVIHSTILSSADEMVIGTSRVVKLSVGIASALPFAAMDFYLEKDAEGNLKAAITTTLSSVPGIAACMLTPVGIGVGATVAIGFGAALLGIGIDMLLDSTIPDNLEQELNLKLGENGENYIETNSDDINLSGYLLSADYINKIETPTETYNVQPGDTLWDIGKKYNLTPQELLDANPDLESEGRVSDDRSYVLLHPGEELIIPVDPQDLAGAYNSSAINNCKNDFNTAKGTEDIQVDPLVLDLDGDGVETVGLTDGAYFDSNNDNFAERTGWVDSDDGVLVFDRNADGIINNGNEVFGDHTELADGSTASSGFAALADLDTNSDGVINASDTDFADLQVLKGDGTLATLAELGIQSISLSNTVQNVVQENGNTQLSTGTFTYTDGTTGQIAEYAFDNNFTYSIETEMVEVSATIEALPDISGYGIVSSLHQAMAKDTTGTLQTLVESFISETNLSNKNSILEDTYFAKVA
ncbi:MAG: LysM domain-containing protein [Candidatus Gastranaerophilales bacterium]|nr:LysM domain-containing protein [Candidatus Gastranaerophilales bacterium]